MLIGSMRPLSGQFALLSSWFIPALVGQLKRISNSAFRLPDLAPTPDHDVWEPDTGTMSGREQDFAVRPFGIVSELSAKSSVVQRSLQAKIDNRIARKRLLENTILLYKKRIG